MDISALTGRLDALKLSSSAAESEAVKLNTYFFTPKSGSKHPDDAARDLKLVVAVLEESKNVGASKVVAGAVGLKDMRAVAAKDLEAMLNRSREQGELATARFSTELTKLAASPLSVPPSLSSQAMIIASDSLGSSAVAVPSPEDPSKTLALSNSDWQKVLDAFKSEGAAIKTITFAEKGETVAYVFGNRSGKISD